MFGTSKKLLHLNIIILTNLTSLADIINLWIFYSKSYKSYCFIYSQTIQNQSEIIKSLADSSIIKLPYGDKNVLYKFPEKWDISRLTKQKKDKQNIDTDSVFNILNAFTYQDIENTNRKSIVTQYPANKFILEPDFIISDSVKKFNKNIEFRSLKVLSKTHTYCNLYLP